MKTLTLLFRSVALRKAWFMVLCLAVVLVYSQQQGPDPDQDEGAVSSYIRFFLPLLPSHSRTTSEWEILGDLPLISRVQSYTLRPGDSFSGALLNLGVSAREIQAIVRAVRTFTNLALVSPGRQIRLLMDETSGLVQLLEYEVGELKRLKIAREGDRFQVTSEAIPFSTEVRFAEGTIVDSFYQSAQRARVPAEVIASFADLFAWDIDFSEEILPGDRYRMVYEANVREGVPLNTGRILAAEIDHQGRRIQAFYFAQWKERGGYFDASGAPIKKAFLKSPLRYSYISSGFSEHRIHPLLHINRPHLGIDYAAPQGTPVMAAADGVVQFFGWRGGYGNCVILDHRAAYSTLYGHLTGFAPGLRVGRRVEQKEIIGYVGSTGISTGPHLHYTFMRHGVPIDPIQAEEVHEEALTGTRLELFRIQIVPFLRWMEVSPPGAV